MVYDKTAHLPEGAAKTYNHIPYKLKTTNKQLTSRAGLLMIAQLMEHAPSWHKKIGKKASKKEIRPNRISIFERPESININESFRLWESNSIVCSQMKW